MHTPLRLTLLACGNPSRGDDALGPALLTRLTEWLAHTPIPDVTVNWIEDFQFQIEHALDLVHCDLALFLDADLSCAPPYRFSRLQPAQDRSYTSHALHPAAVLQVYATHLKQPPPPAFLLGVRGEAFELGAGLSENAAAHLQAAFAWAQTLCWQASAAAWQSHVDGAAAAS